VRSAILLREKLQSKRITIGSLVTHGLWLGLIESAIEAGLDYLIIDAEHFDHGAERIAEFCLVGRLVHFPILLRPARTDTASIRIAMDLGPCGLLLPGVESPEHLDAIRDGIYMPPRGQRRPGGWSNRWVKRFNYETFRTEVEDHIVIIPQIETRAGLRHAREIAAHPITTALGVGPFDLSAELGVCWDPQHPSFVEALAAIHHAAEAAGRPVWMIGNSEELAKQGYNFLCIGDPMTFVQEGFTAAVQSSRAQRPDAGHRHPTD
jgi:2-keto-3-deoxy-L-rhamnonate aldolase RhmA